jgi:hypothetical protein
MAEDPPAFELGPIGRQGCIEAAIEVMSRRHPSLHWYFVPDEPETSVTNELPGEGGTVINHG